MGPANGPVPAVLLRRHLGGMAEIEPGVFVGGRDAIKTITLPEEYGSRVVNVLRIERKLFGTWYYLDNEKPNAVVDDGTQMVWVYDRQEAEARNQEE